MKLKYLAHAAFLFTANKGAKILTDPYEPEGFNGAIGYSPITEAVDAITISHAHADHNYIAPHYQQAKIFNQTGKYEFNDIEILGIKTFHDTKQGKERGENIIFVLKINEIVICHLGDLGHTLNNDTLQAIGKIDVLLIPVGGIFTIDSVTATSVMQSLAPKICIPMHYKTKKLATNLASVDDFIRNKTNVKMVQTSEMKLNKDNLTQTPEIWVLTPAKL
jgi:L-ascorbate metabolism protein UlaG (beta-lactamase superfamily)